MIYGLPSLAAVQEKKEEWVPFPLLKILFQTVALYNRSEQAKVLQSGRDTEYSLQIQKGEVEVD